MTTPKEIPPRYRCSGCGDSVVRVNKSKRAKLDVSIDEPFLCINCGPLDEADVKTITDRNAGAGHLADPFWEDQPPTSP